MAKSNRSGSSKIKRNEKKKMGTFPSASNVPQTTSFLLSKRIPAMHSIAHKNNKLQFLDRVGSLGYREMVSKQNYGITNRGNVQKKKYKMGYTTSSGVENYMVIS